MINLTINAPTAADLQYQLQALAGTKTPAVQASPAIQVPEIGKECHGGFYVGIIGGFHIISALDDIAPVKFALGDEDIKGAKSAIDGPANTAALLGAKIEHPAAEHASAYRGCGADDWYLPSQRELTLALATVPDLFEKDGLYWSSTQLSPRHAWAIGFEHGLDGHWRKDLEFRVRPFRRLPI